MPPRSDHYDHNNEYITLDYNKQTFDYSIHTLSIFKGCLFTTIKKKINQFLFGSYKSTRKNVDGICSPVKVLYFVANNDKNLSL